MEGCLGKHSMFFTSYLSKKRKLEDEGVTTQELLEIVEVGRCSDVKANCSICADIIYKNSYISSSKKTTCKSM